MISKLRECDDWSVAIVGLGYVGLPLALTFGSVRDVVAYDYDSTRVGELLEGFDRNGEISSEELKAAKGLRFESSLDALRGCDCFIITVPTPIDAANKPELTALLAATKAVGSLITRGALVIYESTVYPGCTTECASLLAEVSGLRFNIDFFCGYSPERVNPGDKVHGISNVTKVTSGSTPLAAASVDELYAGIVAAGTYRAASIEVAEAAKVFENVQRDVNIALVNELAVICANLDISVNQVLDAASTKWNFNPFRPGLVGGHCIGVDPYYLISKAEAVGYSPELMIKARQLNESFVEHIAKIFLSKTGGLKKNAEPLKVLVCGASFKENCLDARNSKSLALVQILRDRGCEVDVYDPVVDAKYIQLPEGVALIESPPKGTYDGIIVAVGHDVFREAGSDYFDEFLRADEYILDLKNIFPERKDFGRL